MPIIEMPDGTHESPVYPGHPMVLALQAMLAFPSAAHAFAKTEYGWSVMVGSSHVSGAGDCAHAADAVLRSIWSEQTTPEQSIIAADDYWRRLNKGHEDRFRLGQAQADKLRQAFLDACTKWDWI